MLNFFKIFGKGILYIIGLPFILAFLLLYSVYCLVMFIYMAFKNIVIFFSGGTPNGDMKEDIEAKKILLARQEKENAVNDLLLRAYNSQPINQPQQNVFNQQPNINNQPTANEMNNVETPLDNNESDIQQPEINEQKEDNNGTNID